MIQILIQTRPPSPIQIPKILRWARKVGPAIVVLAELAGMEEAERVGLAVAEAGEDVVLAGVNAVETGLAAAVVPEVPQLLHLFVIILFSGNFEESPCFVVLWRCPRQKMP